jgi:hypothetical protein
VARIDAVRAAGRNGNCVVLRRQAANLRPVLALAFPGSSPGRRWRLGYDELSPADFVVSSRAANRRDRRPVPARACPFFSIKTYEQTMPFYLNRTLTLVDFYDEMNLGLDLEPEKGIQTMEEFRERWSALDAGYATMKPEVFDEAGCRQRTDARARPLTRGA